MNERVIELYKQAVTFAHNIAGKDAGKGTIIESLTAGKFAELIVRECADLFEVEYGQSEVSGNEVARVLKEHFGVEE